MKRPYSFVIAFGILTLFFIQLAGTLIESIYILDLMNTSLDAKVLGLLFLFAPVFLLAFRNQMPLSMTWILFGLLFLARGVTPYLETMERMITSGIGTGVVLMLYATLVVEKPSEGEHPSRAGRWASAGLALAVGLSVLLRTVNFSIDYSMTVGGGWAGWVLGAFLGLTLYQMNWAKKLVNQSKAIPKNKKRGLTGAVVGIFLLLTLVYFAFSAPAVIARWTEGNYAMIVLMVSLFATGWALLILSKPKMLDRISQGGLLAWNLLFTLSLTGTILAHRVSFPQTPDSLPVVVGAPTLLQQIPLFLMLLLFPVIFLDMRLFFQRIQDANPTPAKLAPGMLMGSLVLVLLVFMHIFTNVWGYVEPVSLWFRNLFWLPYLVIAGGVSLLSIRSHEIGTEPDKVALHPGWAILLVLILIGTGIGALQTGRTQPSGERKTSLMVMTYNIQQANDDFGERSYEQQLALIREVSPDILALQESDAARISLNNNDYVLYYANKLGYYSYYGPSTVTGTYGTAILSKYPLLNTRSVFSFSDQDEIGTAEAEINVDGTVFNIYNVHPDGSDTAMLTWADVLLERSKDKLNVIALGDYNLRDYEEAYQRIDAVFTNAWVSVYPSEIGKDGTDMSGDNRIDHIFISYNLGVREPIYILPPNSWTDHPVHWAEVFWDK